MRKKVWNIFFPIFRFVEVFEISSRQRRRSIKNHIERYNDNY